jgi:hypothetical protein
VDQSDRVVAPMMPDVSFIVTSDRPNCLRHLIACLRVQTSPRWELIVLDQTGRAECLPPVKEVEALGEDRVFWEGVPRIGDVGQLMKMAYTQYARGEWVCVPNDDAYYVPSFIDQMLWPARASKWDLVYCGWLWNAADNTTPYRPMPGIPRFGLIDVGGFMVKREALIEDGWPDRGEGGDGHLVERIAARRPHGAVPDGHILYVKN